MFISLKEEGGGGGGGRRGGKGRRKGLPFSRARMEGAAVEAMSPSQSRV